MLRYVMMRILALAVTRSADAQPGRYCTSLGRLGGIEPARLTDAKPGTEGPRGTGVEGLAAAYRDRFPVMPGLTGHLCAGRAPVWNRRAPRAGL
jgi:hypothetical protein